MNDEKHLAGGGDVIELVTFHLGELWIGIDILQVQQVIRHRDLTPVPHAPSFVRGVLEQRGEVITIVDLRRILDLGTTPIDADTRIVIVHSQSERIGILVDRVGDIVVTGEESIEPASGNMNGSIARYVDRVHQTADALLCILDLDAALAAGETEAAT